MIASRNGWEDAVQAQFSVGENVNQQNKVFCDNIVPFFKAVKCPLCYVF